MKLRRALVEMVRLVGRNDGDPPFSLSFSFSLPCLVSSMKSRLPRDSSSSCMSRKGSVLDNNLPTSSSII